MATRLKISNSQQLRSSQNGCNGTIAVEVPPRTAHLRTFALPECVKPGDVVMGTFPILCEHARDTDKLVGMAEEILEKEDYVHRGQIVGIVAGTRTKSGATNFMRLHMIGDSGGRGRPDARTKGNQGNEADEAGE